MSQGRSCVFRGFAEVVSEVPWFLVLARLFNIQRYYIHIYAIYIYMYVCM